MLTCTGCSLLCTDVSLEMDGTASQFANACGKGRAFLERIANPIDRNVIVDGKESSIEFAVDRSVAELESARMPLICGLADQSCETQLATIELARQLNAAIDWTSDISPFAWHAALQQTGRVSCSISEMTQSADLVVVWASDPDSSHPRLFESFAGEIIVIDADSNETSHRASRNFIWSKNQQQMALRYLRERLAGISTGDFSSEESFAEQLAWLEERLLDAKDPVFVVDERFAELHGNVGTMSLSLFIRELNKRNHCRLVNLTSEPNHRGALETFTSQTGAPFGILFREHEALFRGRDASTTELIRSGTLDLIVIVGHEISDSLSAAIAKTKARTICIGSAIPDANIVVPTKRWGMDESGTGFATDGTPVHAGAFRESALSRPVELINAIRVRIQQTAEGAAR